MARPYIDQVIAIHREEGCAVMIIYLVYMFGELDVLVIDEYGRFIKNLRISILLKTPVLKAYYPSQSCRHQYLAQNSAPVH